MKRVIVGITGASGALIGERLVRCLLDDGNQVDAILSASAVMVFDEELGVRLAQATPRSARIF